MYRSVMHYGFFRDPSKKCSNNGWKSRGSSLVSPFYGAGSVIVLSAYFWAKCVHLWCSKGSLKSGHPLKSALEVTNIIIWGRKRFIRLRPLDYHTARTQEIVKGGGAVYLNPLLCSLLSPLIRLASWNKALMVSELILSSPISAFVNFDFSRS